jgi:hypothetical protein
MRLIKLLFSQVNGKSKDSSHQQPVEGSIIKEEMFWQLFQRFQFKADQTFVKIEEDI